MLEALVCVWKRLAVQGKEADNQGQDLCEDQPINTSALVIPSGTNISFGGQDPALM